MKFLVIVQDLRISGTSEGIVSRSFLSKLRSSYPQSIIDVTYMKYHDNDDKLELLPVNKVDTHQIDIKIPFFLKLVNSIYWRIFHVSLNRKYILKQYSKAICKVDSEKYDHIFIRSAGLSHETILAAKNLPVLKKAIVNFHDPFPVYWYVGSQKELSNVELYEMKEMQKVVSQAKVCISPANCMSNDMEYLYGSKKKFYTLPHQFKEDVFDLSDSGSVLKKGKKLTIAYHGAIQFGRNIEILLDAYHELIKDNPDFKQNTEFVLRMKGVDLKKLYAKYAQIENIIILDTLNFSNSYYEQKHVADINIILENGPLYCNILVGKAPFLAATGKPILSLSPERSELRNIIKDDKYIAYSNNKNEIRQKLENLIVSRLNSEERVYPFGDYFSDQNFDNSLKEILSV